jgi:hypothetical protein
MMRKYLLLLVVISGVQSGFCFDQFDVVHTTGVGNRAFGLANNFVALSNDQSGSFWNPAGLAFSPAREFQVGFDALSQRTNSDFFDQKSTSVVQRLRLTNIGYMHSFPVSQGGFTLLGAFQSPYTFDDVRRYSGSYTSVDGNTVHVQKNEKIFGALNYWTGSFGLQVAEGLGVGASVSLVTGSKDSRDIFVRDTNGRVTNGIANDTMYTNDYDQKLTRSYLGYDIRLGVLYSFLRNFKLGMRFVLPQTVWFSEDVSETYPNTPGEPDYSSQSTGTIFSSYSGALGLSGVFPFLTFSTEVRARAPYSFAYPAENIPDKSLASKAIVGAGAGVEVPLFTSTTLLRAGYSWDQYDKNLFTDKYDDNSLIYWDQTGREPKGDQHLVTLGTAFIMKSTCLEISYGYNFWILKTNDVLQESYAQHRILASLSFRF